jgi:hypothetical protein
MQLIVPSTAAAFKGFMPCFRTVTETAFNGLSATTISDMFTNCERPDFAGDTRHVAHDFIAVQEPMNRVT